MGDIDQIFEIAKKTVMEESLTAEELGVKKQILAGKDSNEKDSYIKYCCAVAALDIMEQKGTFAPKFQAEDLDLEALEKSEGSEETVEVKKEKKTTMTQN